MIAKRERSLTCCIAVLVATLPSPYSEAVKLVEPREGTSANVGPACAKVIVPDARVGARAEQALAFAAQRGAMRPLSGALGEVRVARLNASVGELNRTLLVVESKTLLVSLVRLALETEVSARGMMERLAAIEATMVRTSRTGMGRRPTVHLAPNWIRCSVAP
jgi:hypothetical protein